MGEKGSIERNPACLGDDRLTPEEFLEERRRISENLDGDLMTRDEAVDALETLALDNPTMLATWEADLQRQM